MRLWALLLVAALVATGCSATETLVAEPEPQILIEDESGEAVVFGDPDATTVCDAVSAVPMSWADDALVPVQAFVDTWSSVDAPDVVAADVAALLAHAQQRQDWYLGRIDRQDRPEIELALAESIEAVVDHAALNCSDLALRAGYADDWAANAGMSAQDATARCAASSAMLAEGIELYRSWRGANPGHTAQIEAAAQTELYRALADDADWPPFWFAPELHGLRNGETVALAPCAG